VNSSQFVKIAVSRSSVCSISGTPQDSALRPVLLIIYVHDVCELVPACIT